MINEPATTEVVQEKRDHRGRFVKGQSGNPTGRNAGIRNKATQIKLAFFNVFQRIGGVEALQKWAEESKFNKREFYKMTLSILPKDITIENEGAETKIVIIYPPEYKPTEAENRITSELIPSQISR